MKMKAPSARLQTSADKAHNDKAAMALARNRQDHTACDRTIDLFADLAEPPIPLQASAATNGQTDGVKTEAPTTLPQGENKTSPTGIGGSSTRLDIKQPSDTSLSEPSLSEPSLSEPSLADLQAIEAAGMPWAQIERLIAQPARLVMPILKLLVLLRREPKMTLPIAVAAQRIKATEPTIVMCIEHMPALLKLTSRGRQVQLDTTPPDPLDLDMAAIKTLEKQEAAERKALERRQHAAEQDAADTPFNHLRRKLIELHLMPDDAKKFAGFLVRTYTTEAALSAASEAEKAQPADAKSYIMGILKRALQNPGGSFGGRTRTVKMNQRPDAQGQTRLIGWEDQLHNGIRHKLFRLPEGRLTRQPPDEDEDVPDFTSEPGYHIID